MTTAPTGPNDCGAAQDFPQLSNRIAWYDLWVRQTSRSGTIPRSQMRERWVPTASISDNDVSLPGEFHEKRFLTPFPLLD
jgi:hypothetical protein